MRKLARFALPFLAAVFGLAVTALVPYAIAQTTSNRGATSLTEGGGTPLSLATIADGELLYRSGTTVDGLAQTTFLKLAGVSGGQTAAGGTLTTQSMVLQANAADPGSVKIFSSPLSSNLEIRTAGSSSTALSRGLYFESGVADDVLATFVSYGETFATSALAGMLNVYAAGSKGIQLQADHATGDVNVFAGGATAGDLVATFADDLSTTLAGDLVLPREASGTTIRFGASDGIRSDSDFSNDITFVMGGSDALRVGESGINVLGGGSYHLRVDPGAAGNKLAGGDGSGEHLLIDASTHATKGDITMTATSVITSATNVVPATDNVTNLGTDSKRWAVVRGTVVTAGDLDLGYSDGAGEWTLREGPEDIYVVNRRNGKRYKLAMIPVGNDEYFPPKYVPRTASRRAN